MELGGHFKFHSGCDPTDGHAGPVVGVSPEPFCSLALYLLNSFKDFSVQPFGNFRVLVTQHAFIPIAAFADLKRTAVQENADTTGSDYFHGDLFTHRRP